MADAKERIHGVTAGGGSIEGATFFIPLVIPEELESGDGRKFAKDAIDMRDLPLPLMWQIKSGPGHDGSVVVGKITHMERTKQGIGHAYGVFDAGAYGREAERLVRGGFIRGVSADLDRFEANEEEIEASDDETRKLVQVKSISLKHELWQSLSCLSLHSKNAALKSFQMLSSRRKP